MLPSGTISPQSPAGIEDWKGLEDMFQAIGQPERKSISRKRPREYYARASRRCRNKKREGFASLMARNEFLEQEIYLMRGKINLYHNYLEIEPVEGNEYFALKMQNENELLKREISMLKCAEKQIAPILSTFHMIQQVYSHESMLNSNLFFMMNKFLNLATTTAKSGVARQPLLSLEERFEIDSRHDRKFQEIKSYLIRSLFNDPADCVIDKADADCRNAGFDVEVRSVEENYERCFRVDIKDFPVPTWFLKKYYRQIETIAWPSFASEMLPPVNGKEEVVKFSLDKLNNAPTSVLAKFDPKLLKVRFDSVEEELTFLSAEDTPQSLTRDHFPVEGNVKDATMIVYCVLPDEKSNLEDNEIRGATLLRGSIFREGSNPATSHMTALFRCKYSHVEGSFPIDNLAMVKFIRKNAGLKVLQPKIHAFLRSCVFAYSIEQQCMDSKL